MVEINYFLCPSCGLKIKSSPETDFLFAASRIQPQAHSRDKALVLKPLCLVGGTMQRVRNTVRVQLER